jgi:hypothetical protein
MCYFDFRYTNSMSTPRTKLEQLITEAEANVGRAYSRLRQAEESGLKEVVRPTRQKFHNASRRLELLKSLLVAREERMKELLDHAATKRSVARNVEELNPAQAKLMRREAASIEKRYLLWCDHHGKLPELLGSAKSEQVSIVEEQKPVESSRRGGKRSGAGRPALGRVQLLLKCAPTTAEKARRLAKERGISLGDLLESVLNSIAA